MDRRNFISTFVRSGIVVGLTAASGYLILRKQEKGSECNSICNGCKTLPSCAKPEAIQAKNENKLK